MKTVHSEIAYFRTTGGSVHSDICPPNCSSDGLKDAEYDIEREANENI